MEMKRVWDNYKEIGEVRKSDKIKFVVAAATRKGFRYINIREFYFKKADGVWKPGKDGITIPLKAGINNGEKFITPYENLINVLGITAEKLETMDLMDEENAVYMPKK